MEEVLYADSMKTTLHALSLLMICLQVVDILILDQDTIYQDLWKQ